MPRNLDDERPGDLVVPHLLFRILEHPQAANPQCGNREDGGQSSHERVSETQISPLHPHHAQPHDDPAERGSAPGPERDVIGEQQQRVAAVMTREIQNVDGDADQDRVEGKRSDAVQKRRSWVDGKIGRPLRRVAMAAGLWPAASSTAALASGTNVRIGAASA